MNRLLLAAAVLAFLVGLTHSILGEARIFRRMRQGGLIPTNGGRIIGEGQVRIVWASWHVLTVFGWCLAAMLLWLSQGHVANSPLISRAIVIAMLSGALLVLVGTKGKHPGWVGLLGVALLVWAASLTAAHPAVAQVPDDLRAAMSARDTAFYAVDSAQWEQYTGPAFTTVQQDGSFLTRAERLATLRTQTPRPHVPRSREQNERRGEVVLARFFSGGLWVLEVWTRESGTWMVVMSQVTTAKP